MSDVVISPGPSSVVNNSNLVADALPSPPIPPPTSDILNLNSYPGHPYSASTIPPQRIDDSSSEIPTSNEGTFSSSQLFVRFDPSEPLRNPSQELVSGFLPRWMTVPGSITDSSPFLFLVIFFVL
jgi:hypothetical protein